jgi:Actin-like ATPase involved in cell division
MNATPSFLTSSKPSIQQEDSVVVALDIGCNNVKMAAARVNEHNRLDVLAICSEPVNQAVRRGDIENVDEATNAILKVRHQCEHQSGLMLDQVYVGLSGRSVRVKKERSIITRPDKDKEIDQTDLDRLREDVSRVSIPEGHEILHVVPQYYAVDSTKGIRQPLGFTGLRLECTS